MARHLHSLLIFAALTAPAAAQEGKVFAAFPVVAQDVGKTERFIYSEAAASQADPIVISVEGRPLTVQDREYRVDLQKHWLTVNIPEHFAFVDRSLTPCNPEPERTAGRCDRYEFADADTVHAYYFRVDHWPQ